MPVQGMTYEYDVVIAAAGTCHLLNIFGAKFKLEPIDGVCVVHFPVKFTLHICIRLISADIILACLKGLLDLATSSTILAPSSNWSR
jgi:hypothetical protein